jgi:hypothetical protein
MWGCQSLRSHRLKVLRQNSWCLFFFFWASRKNYWWGARQKALNGRGAEQAAPLQVTSLPCLASICLRWYILAVGCSCRRENWVSITTWEFKYDYDFTIHAISCQLAVNCK